MMKVFKHISPRQMARYVKRFHHGSMLVETLGRLDFNDGKITLTSLTCRQTLSLAGQINREVSNMRSLSGC